MYQFVSGRACLGLVGQESTSLNREGGSELFAETTRPPFNATFLTLEEPGDPTVETELPECVCNVSVYSL